MTRLLIIGNSHAGALKRAWDEISPRPAGIDVTFFAAPDIQLRLFRLQKTLRFGVLPRDADRFGSLRTVKAVNGATSISLAGFDAVLLYGGRTLQGVLVDVMHDYDIDGLRAVGAPRRMSRPAFDSFIAGLAETNLPRPFWLNARLPRLAVFPRPIPAEGAARSDLPVYSGWSRIADHPEGVREILELNFAAMAAAHARHGIDFLRQPDSTLEPNGLTSAAFSKGSQRLVRGEEHPPRDFSHMNASYGALCLKPILEWASQPALVPV